MRDDGASAFRQGSGRCGESEARYRSGGARALEGITVAVKDEYDRRGWTVTSGSELFKDKVSKDNHPVIDKLVEAGAILHVQTTSGSLAGFGQGGYEARSNQLPHDRAT